MSVERAQPRIAGEENVESVAATLAVQRDGAGGGGTDRCVDRARQVDPAVEVMRRALHRPWLDLEGGAAKGLGDGRIVDRHQQRAGPLLPSLDHHAGDQQRHHQAGDTEGEQGPAPGPGEHRQPSRGEHRYALDALVAVPIAPLMARFASPSARCWAFSSTWEEAFINPGTLMSR